MVSCVELVEDWLNKEINTGLDKAGFRYYKKYVYKKKNSKRFQFWRANTKEELGYLCDTISASDLDYALRYKNMPWWEAVQSGVGYAIQLMIILAMVVGILALLAITLLRDCDAIILISVGIVAAAFEIGVLVVYERKDFNNSCARKYAVEVDGIAREVLAEKRARASTEHDNRSKAVRKSGKNSAVMSKTQGTKDPIKTNALIEEIIQNQRNKTLDECGNVIEEIIQEKRIKSPDSAGEQECTIHLNLQMTCTYPLNPENDLGQ